MKILHVCSELYPLLKTGGLADVTAALSNALVNLKCDARVIVPGFPAFMNGVTNKKLIQVMPEEFGVSIINLYYGTLPNSKVGVYIIDAKGLYDRSGNPYQDNQGIAYADNYRRFALLGYIAAKLAEGLDNEWKPQIVHGHDWHAGLTFAYLKAHEIQTGKKAARSVFTIHNLAYQGTFPKSIFDELNLPISFFDINGLEFYGNISFLKSGLFFADKLTTVSPTYAIEIQHGEQGCGFDGLLSKRKHDLVGILNGIDKDVWNPATDIVIDKKFSHRSMSGKLTCKTSLQKQLGLTVQNDVPLFVVVSRLAEQKGLNLILDEMPNLIKLGGQLVLLGSGDPKLEEAFRSLSKTYPKSISVKIGYDEEYAHQIIASSDVILVPSRYEPCGLTQLYGMTYGTLPVVHNVGGLADTVVDCSLENLDTGKASGFVFDQFSTTAFNAALRRAFALYKRRAEWKRVQKYAMGQDFSWDNPALQYFSLYKQLFTAG
ncbi:MAG: glgA [Burkholderiales bacterium]|jgi:starch synthase|nr:glgA [Burkholderiales bacterium]